VTSVFSGSRERASLGARMPRCRFRAVVNLVQATSVGQLIGGIARWSATWRYHRTMAVWFSGKPWRAVCGGAGVLAV